MKVLVIFLILIGFVGIAYANEPKSIPGELDKPPIEIWNESRAIMDGTITEKKQSEEWTNYDITINEMFKGTTKSKSITGFIPRNMDWILDKGDRALIYLKSGNEISVYSVKSSNTCTPRDLIQISPVLPNDNSIVRGAPVLPWDWKDPCVPNYFTYDPDFWNYMEYKPPLRQYVDHNLPLHMQKCGNDEHVSVIPKSHPYHIACVTESTKQKLIQRGWAEHIETNESGLAKWGYPTDTTAHIKANNQFAIDFYSEVSTNVNSNVFFSPASLSNAFAILYEGTRGNTANELQQTFGFPQNDLDRKHGYLSLNKKLNKNTDGVALKLSNALWLANNFKPLPEYVDTAQKFYDINVESIDFTAGYGHQTINQWVKNQTEGKIEQLFDELEPSTVFVITNTIYFDGTWKTQFDPKDTKNREFYLDSETVSVPMMVMQNTNFNYIETDNLQMVEIPYRGDKKSMLILLPESMNLQSIEDTITIDKISELKEKMRERHIAVMIPKFSLETDYNLVKILPEMGVHSIFNTDADFGKMTNANGLYVYNAIHKAVVDVDESGTEAAAATGIGGFMSGPPSFIADHPFMFIIQDNETGQILFMGRVVNPAQ